MHRVVTFTNDHRGRRCQENGPWLQSHGEAEHWAGLLKSRGYVVRVESLSGEASGGEGDGDWRSALASMA